MAFWEQRMEAVRRMTTSRSFEDYPGSESGENLEETPGTYGNRKPISPIVEEDEEPTEEVSRKHKGNMEGVAGGGAGNHRATTSPRSSTSPKQSSSLSPSSGSDHSSSRSPPTYPPPPSSMPPPLPAMPTRGHTHHATASNKPHSGSAKRQNDRKQPYEAHMVQYGGHPGNPAYRPHPHYPPNPHGGYQNQNESHSQSHSMKQSGSGSRYSHSTEVVVNSKVVPTKQYAKSLSDQSHSEITSSEPPSGKLPEHPGIVGDPGVRECPSGASSPGGTPNNTLGKSAKVSYHYDPLAASDSESKLMRHSGVHQPPQDGLETQSDSNLLNYPQYGGGGGVAMGRGHVGGQAKVVQKPQKSGGGVRGTIRNWESRGSKPEGERVDGMLPTRVLHLPISSSAKRGGEQNMATPNGYTTGGGKASRALASMSPEQHPGPGHGSADSAGSGGGRPPSSDSGYVPSSSSAHSLSPLHNSHTPPTETAQDPGADRASGGMSPSSSAEELAQINEPSDKEGGIDQSDGSTHQILKPEPTTMGSKQMGVSGGVVSGLHHPPGGHGGQQQATPQAPPPVYHPSEHQQHQQQQGGYPHSGSLSQPMPPPALSHGLNQPTGQMSLSQGPAYYHHHHPNSRVDGPAPPTAPPYGSGYTRQKMAYENVPMVYESLQGSARHSHLPHPHPQAPLPPGKYGGMGQPGPPGQQQQPPPGATGYGQRAMMRPGPYGMGAGSRWKPINPASVSVAHDAAASGDIATLHHMLSNQEIDSFTFTEHKFSLAHKAALHGQLGVLNFLVSDAGLPLTALQLSDDSFSTPAMLAIQGGHVECLQCMVEEYKVPLEVRDTGGETLMHHAAYNGQVKCLEWLLKTIKKKEDQQHIEILDESGVTPAHFAAQGGHLDCLQLLIDHSYSVVHADQEGQKPLDWADAMNQTVCVRYLMMYEACWALSAEVTHLSEQLVHLRKEYDKVRETLTLQTQDHQHAIGLLQQSHEERITKIREQYVDLTAHLLKNTGAVASSSGSSGGGGGGGGAGGGACSSGITSPVKTKSQASRSKAPDPPGSHRRASKPPVPPDAAKKHSVRSGQNHEHKAESPEVDYRTVTPQEVMKKQLSTVAQRMTLNREHRKHHGGLIPRNYSPLTPIIQRYNSKEEETGKPDRQARQQRHSESHDKRGVGTKAVKFSNTVTEFPPRDFPPGRFDEDSRTKTSGHKFSSGHSGTNHSSPGHSPGHSVPGHNNSGQYDSRTVPDGDSGHSKADSTRKLSANK